MEENEEMNFKEHHEIFKNHMIVFVLVFVLHSGKLTIAMGNPPFEDA